MIVVFNDYGGFKSLAASENVSLMALKF